MKKIVKLTESDITRIVGSVLNERRMSAVELIKDMTLKDVVSVVNSFSEKQISLKEVKEKIEYMFRDNRGRMNENYENSLYSDIMKVISNSSHEETLSILRDISNEMESSRKVRRGAENRFRNNG